MWKKGEEINTHTHTIRIIYHMDGMIFNYAALFIESGPFHSIFARQKEVINFLSTQEVQHSCDQTIYFACFARLLNFPPES